jgi:hypothetical protein
LPDSFSENKKLPGPMSIVIAAQLRKKMARVKKKKEKKRKEKGNSHRANYLFLSCTKNPMDDGADMPTTGRVNMSSKIVCSYIILKNNLIC